MLPVTRDVGHWNRLDELLPHRLTCITARVPEGPAQCRPGGSLRCIGHTLDWWSSLMVGAYIEPSEVGTPQGEPLSPLLANVLLHQLDCELEKRATALRGMRTTW